MECVLTDINRNNRNSLFLFLPMSTLPDLEGLAIFARGDFEVHTAREGFASIRQICIDPLRSELK